MLLAEAVMHRAVAGGGGYARGEPRGSGACRQYDRSSWGSVAGTESLKDAAADVAGARKYAACIGGQLCYERVPANAGRAWMMLRAAGWGVCARGCSGRWGLCEGRAEGRRCVQAIGLEMMGRHR